MRRLQCRPAASRAKSRLMVGIGNGYLKTLDGNTPVVTTDRADAMRFTQEAADTMVAWLAVEGHEAFVVGRDRR